MVENGIIVSPSSIDETASAILTLLKDSVLYEKMKKNTLKEIETHYIEKVVDEWEKIYNEHIYKYHIGDFKFKKAFSFIFSAVPLFIVAIIKLAGSKILSLIKGS